MTEQATQNDQQKPKRSRGGRPRLGENEIRCVKVLASFSIPEITEIEERAEKAGLSVGAFLRVTGLDQHVRTVPAINRTTYAELARLAGNLNQLAAAANSGVGLDSQSVVQATEAARIEVQMLRKELLGKGGFQ